MSAASREPLLRRVAELANTLGPALAPASQLELLQATVSAGQGLFEAAACSIALLTADHTELVFSAASGAGGSEIVGVRIPVDRGLAGWAITSGQLLAIEDVSQDPRFARDIAQETGYVPTSIVAIPLVTERGPLGVLEILDRGPNAPDMNVASAFAYQTALAIESGSVPTRAGAVLFGALADASDDDDLKSLLAEAGQQLPSPDRDLLEIARLLSDLAELGEEERTLAVSVLRGFVDYAESRP